MRQRKRTSEKLHPVYRVLCCNPLRCVVTTEAGSRVRLPSIYRVRRGDAIGPQPFLGFARSQPAPVHPSHNVRPIKQNKQKLHIIFGPAIYIICPLFLLHFGFIASGRTIFELGVLVNLIKLNSNESLGFAFKIKCIMPLVWKIYNRLDVDGDECRCGPWRGLSTLGAHPYAGRGGCFLRPAREAAHLHERLPTTGDRFRAQTSVRIRQSEPTILYSSSTPDTGRVIYDGCETIARSLGLSGAVDVVPIK
ncbi:unnamed protein product [Danaus chrysippus]|uniref:(African queen) hypothetical protein n=1 Tax=Danaus chrysippus TaxID=151541 RepID=A0A8J2R5A1_9NEOP|nr:unnamed protein product [Danaus chrysippus]